MDRGGGAKGEGKGKGWRTKRWEIMNEEEIAEEGKERQKGEKCGGGKKEEEERKKKSGEPAGRNELEVNQTYRSYRSRYHYHLPNYYLQQVYIWTLPRLSYPMRRRIVCRNSEITYLLYTFHGLCGCSRLAAARNSIPFGIQAPRTLLLFFLVLPRSRTFAFQFFYPELGIRGHAGPRRSRGVLCR